ncbi:MAG TPA: hemerythrin domain-containing protein [Pseudonocardiaceae bacterium]
MDALDLLTADHNRVRGLFARFKEAQENDDTATMSELAAMIFEELRVHTAIEEQIFYPAVHDLDDVADVVDEGVEEHHVVDVLMEEAKALDAADPRWVAKVTVLIENVEHHAGEEEEELFPRIRQVTGEATRAEWGERMERMKAEEGAPTSADAEGMSVEELRALAGEQQIPGRSTMDRTELAATVDAR